jgi:glycosyltransferase involved in cell wall biosynthesis
MKILLIGNHPHDNTHSLSMSLFADCLHQGLLTQGHEVRLLRPEPSVWRVERSRGWRGKWAKYLDQFLLFPAELRRQEAWADVVHVCDHSNAPFLSYLAGKPHVVTCHDVIGIKRALGHYHEEQAGRFGRALQAWTMRALRKADRIACVSRTVEHELRALVAVDAGRVSTVYNGLNYPYRPMDEAEIGRVLEGLDLPMDRPLVLHVGSDEWKKNRRGVAEIFVELKRMGHPVAGHLVFVGAPVEEGIEGYMRDAGMRDAVGSLTQLSSAQLRALYSKSSLFLFPSLYEGFGWPIIEAQACGALVVTSDRDPMREVAGDGALLVDPEDALVAAERIAGLTESRQEKIRLRGLLNARRFSAEAMIAGYVALYEAVLAERGGLGREPGVAGFRASIQPTECP